MSSNNSLPPKILRIGIIRDGELVEERLFRRQENITIGQSPKNTIVIAPGENVPDSWQLFAAEGKGQYSFIFGPPLSGLISLGGPPVGLPALTKAPGAKRSGRGFRISLSHNARGKLLLGETTILFQFIPAPPIPPPLRLPPECKGGWMQDLDAGFIVAVVFSALIQVGVTLWMVTQDWPAEVRTVENMPDRFVSLMIDIPKPKTDLEDMETTTEEDAEAMAAAEKAKKAEEEKRKTEEEEKKKLAEKEAAEAKPKDAETIAQEQAARREKITQQLREKTLLMFLTSKGDGSSGSGGVVQDLLGDGYGSGDGIFSGLTNLEVATSENVRQKLEGGQGSLSSVDIEGTTIGGTIDKNITERAEKKVTANLKVTNPDSMVGSGKLDSKAVAEVVRRRISAVKNCYERELRRNPKLEGNITVQFTISQMGRVSDVNTIQNTMNSDSVASCIVDRIRGWRFPSPEGGSVTVSYPFIFTASN